jgi:hypothetical protein
MCTLHKRENNGFFFSNNVLTLLCKALLLSTELLFASPPPRRRTALCRHTRLSVCCSFPPSLFPSSPLHLRHCFPFLFRFNVLRRYVHLCVHSPRLGYAGTHIHTYIYANGQER